MAVVLMARRIALPIGQICFAVGLVLVWQWASSNEHIDPFFFGTPTKVWDELKEFQRIGLVRKSLESTLTLLALGFSSGLIAGTVLGTILAFSRLARDVLEPFVIFFNAIPRLILYPFLIVWLGFGLSPKVLTIALVMMPTVAINTLAGFSEVEGAYLSNLRALGAGRLDLARQVYLPSIGVWLLSTCRVSFAFALQAAIVAELLASTTGIGFLVVEGQSHFNVNQIYAALMLVVVIAIAADLVLQAMERRASRWMPAR